MKLQKVNITSFCCQDNSVKNCQYIRVEKKNSLWSLSSPESNKRKFLIFKATQRLTTGTL